VRKKNICAKKNIFAQKKIFFAQKKMFFAQKKISSSLKIPSSRPECSTNASTAYLDLILMIDTSANMGSVNLRKVIKKFKGGVIIIAESRSTLFIGIFSITFNR
jgi:hypothetical protein